MTKEQFKKAVAGIMKLNLVAEATADAILARCFKSFDPQLAAMVQTLADTKRAIHDHVEKKRER